MWQLGKRPPFPIPYSLVPAFQAPVAKWLTRRSAKPVFVGSKPTRCSKIQNNEKGRNLFKRGCGPSILLSLPACKTRARKTTLESDHGAD